MSVNSGGMVPAGCGRAQEELHQDDAWAVNLAC